MNETAAATQQVVQFHAGPLFWILAVATVVGCFIVVGRESAKGTTLGMSLVIVSLGGLFAMTSSVIPAALFVIPGILFFAPILNSLRENSISTIMWRGVRPALAFVICTIVALLTITLIQGTQVWLYADKAAEQASLDRLSASFGGAYLVAFVTLAVLTAIALYARRRLDIRESA